jgi:hypothetical protein
VIDEQFREMTNSNYASDASEKIYRKYLYKQFAKLFERLDSDEDG